MAASRPPVEVHLNAARGAPVQTEADVPAPKMGRLIRQLLTGLGRVVIGATPEAVAHTRGGAGR